MKSSAGRFNKGYYRINQFSRFFALCWAINCWMFNIGYCGTQSLEFQSFFIRKIPFFQTCLLDKCGDQISIGFFPSFKTTVDQSCPANFITPARHQSQERSFSTGYASPTLSLSDELVRPKRDTNTTSSSYKPTKEGESDLSGNLMQWIIIFVFGAVGFAAAFLFTTPIKKAVDFIFDI